MKDIHQLERNLGRFLTDVEKARIIEIGNANFLIPELEDVFWMSAKLLRSLDPARMSPWYGEA